MIKHLVVDRLAIIRLPPQDKDNIRWRFFIAPLTYIVIKSICQGETVNFRVIYKLYDKLYDKLRQSPSQKDTEFNKTNKAIPQMLSDLKLKEKGDLVDCDIIPLAFLGRHGSKCHIYTTDDENIITKRLKLCCCYISSIISLIFDEGILSNYIKNNNSDLFSQIKKKEHPEFKFGKVFILDKKTGEKIKQISTEEIYNKPNDTI